MVVLAVCFRPPKCMPQTFVNQCNTNLGSVKLFRTSLCVLKLVRNLNIVVLRDYAYFKILVIFLKNMCNQLSEIIWLYNVISVIYLILVGFDGMFAYTLCLKVGFVINLTIAISRNEDVTIRFGVFNFLLKSK